MRYPNQLQVKLTGLEKIKHKYKSGCRFIPSIDYKYEQKAMQNLNGNAFKLWRYLLKWYGKKAFFFSPAEINQALGFGENGATNARNELEKKGYLTKDPDKTNCYIFCPVLPVDYENLKNKFDWNYEEDVEDEPAAESL